MSHSDCNARSTAYTEIRNTIARLTHLLKDMNTLTPDMHARSGFEELFRAVERKLAE